MLHVNVSRARPRQALCFDLENRPLAYWYDGETTSEITAFGWKWEGERQIHTLLLQPDGSFLKDNAESFRCDEAYLSFVGELASAGVVYAHNIRRHDLPMLNAGLLRRQLTPLPPLLTTDTFKDLPRTAGVSKSLENMAAMYDLRGSKLRMSQPDWEDANRLTETGIARARKRVTSDVILQERLRNRLVKLELLKPPRVWRP